jgi:hypothetical protein
MLRQILPIPLERVHARNNVQGPVDVYTCVIFSPPVDREPHFLNRHLRRRSEYLLAGQVTEDVRTGGHSGFRKREIAIQKRRGGL